MAGSKTLNELAERIRKPPTPEPPEVDEDTWDEPSGDGRTSRHACLGVQLIDDKKHLWWIPYGAILWGEGVYHGNSIRFEVLRGDTLYEVVIEGPETELQKIADKFMAGKREQIRVNGVTISGITVRAVPKSRV